MRLPQAERVRLVGILAHQLVTALVQFELAGSKNPTTRTIFAEISNTIGTLTSRDERLRFDFVGPEIRHEDSPLLAASVHAGRFLRLCKERDLSGLEFEQGLEPEEVSRFMEWLADPTTIDGFTPESFAASIAEHGITHIRPLIRRREVPSGHGSADDALRHYQAMSDLLQDSHVAAAHGDELAFDRTAGIVETTLQRMVREPSALLALAAYDEIDSYTVGHSVRVALLALQVGRASGADERQLLRIGTAALLHDIGKSRIPQEILLKQGRLTAEERQLMGAHPRLGGEILLGQKHLDPQIIGAAFCHHMGENGTGYPRPALSFQPSALSRLVRVCDVFEALTAVRPYKAAMTPLQAFALMHKMRDGFDTRILHYFIHVIGVYPLGTRVLLEDGSEAVVIAHGKTPFTPRVRLMHWVQNETVEVDTGITGDGSQNQQVQAVIGAGRVVTVPTDLFATAGAGTGSRPEQQASCACVLHEPPPPGTG